MATYTYETTDSGKPSRRFDIKQGMRDAPLRTDPATGEPVRRLITGGYGILVAGKYKGPLIGSVGNHQARSARRSSLMAVASEPTRFSVRVKGLRPTKCRGTRLL